MRPVFTFANKEEPGLIKAKLLGPKVHENVMDAALTERVKMLTWELNHFTGLHIEVDWINDNDNPDTGGGAGLVSNKLKGAKIGNPILFG